MFFDRKVDADRHDAAMRTDVSRGTYIDPRAGKVTLRVYADKWLAAQTFDPSTREAVELRLRVHVYPTLGDVELRALAQRPQLVQAWIRGLQQRLAANYCRTIFANLSAVFMAAVDENEMTRNPCRVKSVKPPSKEERRIRPWSTERVASVRAGLPARYRATVDAGAGLGLRQGETFGLAVEDIDLTDRIVHVRYQVKYVGARLVFAPPKGGKERDVPLPEVTAARFTAHLEQWPAIPVTLPWLVPTGRPVTRLLVFTGRERTAINRNYYNAHLWKPALVAAGVIRDRQMGQHYDPSREHGFHALRHAYASWLLANGVDIRSLAEYLGHADPGFTLRVYTHLMPSSEEKTRKAIDLALGAEVDSLPSSFVPGVYRDGA
jgi:integrase